MYKKLILILWLLMISTSVIGQSRVRDLGISINSASLGRQILYKHLPDNNTHLQIYYYTGPIWQVPYQLVDVDLVTKKTIVSNGTYGVPAPHGNVSHPNGKVYISSNDPGYLLEFNPSDGSTRQIKKLADKDGQYMEIGDDGIIYIGEAVYGYLESYDPSTDTWVNYGIMDDPGPPYYRYVYTLGADNRYIYCGIGQNPWYLVVYDKQTGTQQTFWKSSNLSVCQVYKGKIGGWYCQAGTLGWFKLENGVPTKVTSAPLVNNWYEHGNCIFDIASQSYGYDYDFSQTTPFGTGVVGTSKIKWKLKTETVWNVVDKDINTIPTTIRQMFPDNGNIFGFCSAYGPLFNFEVLNNKISILSTNYKSNYDALYSLIKKKWYISGYAGATTLYDPYKTWNLTSTVNGYDPQYNPYFLDTIGKYHYYIASDNNDQTYVGIHNERDSTGGSLGWYDNSTNKSGVLKTPFINDDVSDLQPAKNKTKLVYSSNSMVSNDSGKLFIIDCTTKSIERTIIPIPGTPSAGKIIEISPGIIIGVSDKKIYKVDIMSGNIIWVQTSQYSTFYNTPFTDRRLRLGPDGNVYLPIRSSNKDYIGKIDSKTGVIELLDEVPGLVNIVFVNIPNTVYFDAYFYGNTKISKIDSFFPR